MPTTEHPHPAHPEPESPGQIFALGQIFATPGAIDACQEAEADPRTYLARHATGDWGDLGAEDKAANEAALTSGARIFSAYSLPTAERLWIITEADRASTTLLLPLEY